MRVASLTVLFLTGWVLASDTGKEEAAKEELAKLQGTWRRASAVLNGKKALDEELKHSTLTIQGDEYTLKMGEETRKGALKVDPTQKPKAIDIISAAGPNKGKSLLGIYTLEGDTFRYCVAAPGKERPKTFASTPGSGISLFVNKRAKP